MRDAVPPWLPAGFVPPGRVELPTGHHLRPIRRDDVAVDFPAVMGSQARLWSIFGEAWGWPTPDLTFEADEHDLARHEEEARDLVSFNYAVFDAEESRLLGCIYVDPPERIGADAEISWWVVDGEVGGPLEALLPTFVPQWIRDSWPFTSPRLIGHDLTWREWLALPPV